MVVHAAVRLARDLSQLPRLRRGERRTGAGGVRPELRPAQGAEDAVRPDEPLPHESQYPAICLTGHRWQDLETRGRLEPGRRHTMFGTVARVTVQPGKEDEFLAIGEQWTKERGPSTGENASYVF